MINIITAMDIDWAIGGDNSLLWNLPNDMKYFKNLTEGHIVVMGRHTFESIGKPLPKRHNIVMTSDEECDIEGVSIANCLDDVLEFYSVMPDTQNMYIIGGEQIYRQFLPYVDRLYITKVHHKFGGADSYFPPISLWDWEVTEVTTNSKDSKNKYAHDFIVMDRRIINEA